METGNAFSQYDAGGEAPPSGQGRTRRMSMDEDMFYRKVMTSLPTEPPSYESAMRAALAAQRRAAAAEEGPFKGVPVDVLPQYSCDLHMEGVFMRKMEIEDTIKRAEYRNWQMVYVVLHGTALNIYQVKKERGWWSKDDGPDISPDNPPWVKRSTLEKSYSLLHADAGIAADYRKRRYVIRMRVETDQFLLSCVELGNYVKWLECIFAAIDVAAPIDERDFPRDQSIPRVQRIRWLRGQRPQMEDNSTGFQRLNERRQSIASSANDMDHDEEAGGEDGEPIGDDDGVSGYAALANRTEHPIVGRLSTTSYPNEHIDPDTGKWAPQHKWTETHDQLYARLCYAVLLFKSPRKTNYVISKGKRWYVDWTTGRMIRVLPPAYGEVELIGTWSGYMAENRRL
ncbi:hypothetical protein B0T26DRAFT_739917 [Lasiosphaeria miniovina]|uniref:PH domain-containing protein n=1 Tax=Lasiosphaeria miniovina TaxID=1954250 RepID=A0AA40AVK4_9PEZI|nr:uncharacterized protein B0T26DRAFT_739917 [Lasiosphaeria miniovina]KAK0722802.1 hypothetical protein B0T26DRAFT_739917 [Lasiosphaeria miniovina]